MKKTVNRKRLIQAMGVFSVFCLLVLLAIAGGKEMQRTSFSAAKDVKEPSRAGQGTAYRCGASHEESI